jgi:hypothetical protein
MQNKKMRISRRITNSKRHTLGYVVGGNKVTVAQAREMASRGQIAGVQVVGKHIQAIPGKRTLSSLAYTVE